MKYSKLIYLFGFICCGCGVMHSANRAYIISQTEKEDDAAAKADLPEKIEWDLK